MSKRAAPGDEQPYKTVTLEYAALVRGDDLSAKIEEAYGVDGLGILTVSGVPGLKEARNKLLPLASEVAALPDDVKTKYELPEAFYAVGWSHGREKLQGRPDYAKGSYYGNPLHNAPFSDPKVIKEFPAFAAPNKWPDEVPNLEDAFMSAGQLMHRVMARPPTPSLTKPSPAPIPPPPPRAPCREPLPRRAQVGCLVAAQCDRYVRGQCKTYAPTKLADVLRDSKCCKARLLHYFPVAEGTPPPTDEAEAFSNWCGWHNDHGSLTGLMPAMFFDHRPNAAAAEDSTASDGASRRTRARSNAPAPAASPAGTPTPLAKSPDAAAGLYVRGRKGQLVKVGLPSDHLGFQIGETAQVHSGGYLQATPHAVRGCSVPGVSRATYAVFMEPEWDYPMQAPEGVDPDHTQSSGASNFLPQGVPPLRSRWGTKDCPFTTCDFGAFTQTTLEAYH